jgi:hypothetical protein
MFMYTLISKSGSAMYKNAKHKFLPGPINNLFSWGASLINCYVNWAPRQKNVYILNIANKLYTHLKCNFVLMASEKMKKSGAELCQAQFKLVLSLAKF